MSTLPNWTIEQVLKQLILPNAKWQGDITYSYPTQVSGMSGSTTELAGFQAFTLAQQSIHNTAFSLWGDLIAVKLAQANSFKGQIAVAYTDTGIAYAHAYAPEGSGSDGDIWYNKNMNSGSQNLLDPQIGSRVFTTFIHEIGHALGLNHMGNYNGEAGVANGPSSYQDSTVLSIMSYYGPDSKNSGENTVAWANWTGSDGVIYSPQTPMLSDISAIQKIYGASTSTRSGDTIYGFNSNIQGAQADIYNFSINKNPILTIFDSGGVNTIDLSGYKTDSIVYLNQGGMSSINGMTHNLDIAHNTIVQKFIGGDGVDTVSANDFGDYIKGLAGNDIINGGKGIDTAIYRGVKSDYQFSDKLGTFTIVDKIQGRDDTDTLTSIEKIQFSDGTLEFTVQNTSKNSIIYRMYQAALDRSPDEAGFGSWVEKSSNQSLKSISLDFISSDEFDHKYSANSSNTQYVNQLYENALDRIGDAEGITFWTEQLSSGRMTRDEVLLAFVTSTEDINQSASYTEDGYWIL